MGVFIMGTNNSYFSKVIKPGDFIATDSDDDGDWNHVGFVTAKSSRMIDGAYDYQVAQHTNNYIARTSSSTNNWDRLNGHLYGVFRK